MKPLCIYHGNCADGFTAAWAVRKAMDCEFVAGFYGKPAPDVTGRAVIMVDFSYKRSALIEMARAANRLLILDHHKTARDDLMGLGYVPSAWNDFAPSDDFAARIGILFDMARSGAQIAWDFFYGRNNPYYNGCPRPKLIDYVADRDLWQFKLPQSREIAALIFSYHYDFERWDWLAAQMEKNFDFLAAEGAAIERKHFKDIDELLEQTTREMVIGGQRVKVANLPYTMSSDAAGKLAEGSPFGACYFDRPDARVFSLRSRGDAAVDVSVIAASYGGGGHKNAAGFQVPLGWEGDDRPTPEKE